MSSLSCPFLKLCLCQCSRRWYCMTLVCVAQEEHAPTRYCQTSKPNFFVLRSNFWNSIRTPQCGQVLFGVVRLIEQPAGIGSQKRRSEMASVASKMLLRNPSNHNILCHGNLTLISCEAVAGVILDSVASSYRLGHHECFQELHGPIAGYSQSYTKDKPTNSLRTAAATFISESSQWHNTTGAASISPSCRRGNSRCTSIFEPSAGVSLPRQC